MNPPRLPSAIDRRRFLQGTGVALALPTLDAFLPRSWGICRRASPHAYGVYLRVARPPCSVPVPEGDRGRLRTDPNAAKLVHKPCPLNSL